MKSQEQEIKDLLSRTGLENYFEHVLNGFIGVGDITTRSYLPKDTKAQKRIFERDLDGHVPSKDISYWAEQIVDYLHYRGRYSREPSETFELYQEKIKHDRTKTNLGLVIFFLIAIFWGIIQAILN